MGQSQTNILCPLCPHGIGLLAVVQGQTASRVVRGRTKTATGLDADERITYEYGIRGNKLADPIFIDRVSEAEFECRHGHKTKPILTDWIRDASREASEAGHLSVTLNRRQML